MLCQCKIDLCSSRNFLSFKLSVGKSIKRILNYWNNYLIDNNCDWLCIFQTITPILIKFNNDDNFITYFY